MKQKRKSTATYSRALKIHVSQKKKKNCKKKQHRTTICCSAKQRVMCWKYLSGGSVAAWRGVSASTAKLLSSSEDVLHAPKLEKKQETKNVVYMRGSGYSCAIQRAGGRFSFLHQTQPKQMFPHFPSTLCSELGSAGSGSILFQLHTASIDLFERK